MLLSLRTVLYNITACFCNWGKHTCKKITAWWMEDFSVKIVGLWFYKNPPTWEYGQKLQQLLVFHWTDASVDHSSGHWDTHNIYYLYFFPPTTTILFLTLPPAPAAPGRKAPKAGRSLSLLYSFYSILECHSDVGDHMVDINLLCCLQERWKDLW